jgi:Tfp pilus assembly protein FimT
MKLKKGNLESGASVLEVLIVIAIAAVLTTLAISQFGNSKSQFNRQNIARELKNNLERCRFDSVRRRVDDNDYTNMSQIVINSQTSYDVKIDSNQDGVISTAEVRTVNLAQRSDTKIIQGSGTFPISIKFNRKGHITTDAAGVSITPLFTICSGVCSAATTITPTNGNVISISPTGTVSMLYGGDVIPPLAAPSISNVAYNSNIDLMVTQMPKITNVNTSPTPVLNECALNEKPGQTGCTCSLPRYVRNNQKCQ